MAAHDDKFCSSVQEVNYYPVAANKRILNSYSYMCNDGFLDGAHEEFSGADHTGCDQRCQQHRHDGVILHADKDRKFAHEIKQWLVKNLSLQFGDTKHRPKIELVGNIQSSSYVESLQTASKCTKTILLLCTKHFEKDRFTLQATYALWSLKAVEGLRLVPLLVDFREDEAPPKCIPVWETHPVRYDTKCAYFKDTMEKCLSATLEKRLQHDAIRRGCERKRGLRGYRQPTPVGEQATSLFRTDSQIPSYEFMMTPERNSTESLQELIKTNSIHKLDGDLPAQYITDVIQTTEEQRDRQASKKKTYASTPVATTDDQHTFSDKTADEKQSHSCGSPSPSAHTQSSVSERPARTALPEATPDGNFQREKPGAKKKSSPSKQALNAAWGKERKQAEGESCASPAATSTIGGAEVRAAEKSNPKRSTHSSTLPNREERMGATVADVGLTPTPAVPCGRHEADRGSEPEDTNSTVPDKPDLETDIYEDISPTESSLIPSRERAGMGADEDLSVRECPSLPNQPQQVYPNMKIKSSASLLGARKYFSAVSDDGRKCPDRRGFGSDRSPTDVNSDSVEADCDGPQEHVESPVQRQHDVRSGSAVVQSNTPHNHCKTQLQGPVITRSEETLSAVSPTSASHRREMTISSSADSRMQGYSESFNNAESRSLVQTVDSEKPESVVEGLEANIRDKVKQHFEHTLPKNENPCPEFAMQQVRTELPVRANLTALQPDHHGTTNILCANAIIITAAETGHSRMTNCRSMTTDPQQMSLHNYIDKRSCQTLW